MKNLRLGVLTGLALFLSAVCALVAGASGLVPAEEAISDNRARLALIQSLLRMPGGRAEAIARLETLDDEGRDIRLLREIADARISLGHYREGYALYKRLIDMDGSEDERLAEALADRRILWGDFHGAERIWREYVLRNPDDLAAWLRLGAALAGADRYGEAKAVYGKLWRRAPHHPEAGLALARVLMLQKDFPAAAELARRLRELPGLERSAGVLLGDALLSLGDFQGAENVFSRLAAAESADAGDLVRLGRARLGRGEQRKAFENFAEALEKEPGHIEAAFRLAGPSVDTDFFARELFLEESDPERLRRWAELYASEGLRSRALACYEQALRIDPRYFPAAEGRAFVLAVSGEHGSAAEHYRELISDFPESRRLTAGLARALAWGRKYNESLAVYDELIKANPEDLVLRREAARAALWGKMFQDAMNRYEEILSPGVDEQLFSALGQIAGGLPPGFAPALERLAEQKEKGSGHDGFSDWLEMKKGMAMPSAAADIIYSLYGRYEIQRAAALERKYKTLQWQSRYARAMIEASRLIDLTPGDQEAVFDRAQIACVMGLSDLAMADYERLLALDPAHSIAQEALDLARLDARPGLRLAGSYWRERGRSGLSDIQKRTASAGLEIPVWCRTRVFLGAQRLFESPGGYEGRIDSWSRTLGWGGAFNPYLSGELSLTQKQYDLDLFEDTRTGRASLRANLNDIAVLSAGFDRSEELYNRFGFERGTQSDSLWLQLRSDLSRGWDAGINLRDISYNDENHGRLLRLSAGYEFTDHPKILKATLSAEYRDTEKQSRFIFDGDDNLTDIVHPYWTPQDYLAAFLTVELWHDISGPHQYCGNRRHFYDIRAVISADSESNPGITLEAEWQYRFTRRWSAGVRGYAHRSREWDASGVWFSLGCRL